MEGPDGGKLQKVGFPKGGEVSLFSFSCLKFHSSWSLWAFSRGISVVKCWGPPKCTFGLLWVIVWELRRPYLVGLLLHLLLPIPFLTFQNVKNNFEIGTPLTVMKASKTPGGSEKGVQGKGGSGGGRSDGRGSCGGTVGVGGGRRGKRGSGGGREKIIQKQKIVQKSKNRQKPKFNEKLLLLDFCFFLLTLRQFLLWHHFSNCL